MFDLGWSELLIIAVVAILVVGPKELPAMLRTFGRMIGKLRATADDFRQQFDEAVKDAGGDELQRELQALKNNNPLNELRETIDEVNLNPMYNPPSREPKPSPSAGAGIEDDPGPPPPLPPRSAPPVSTATEPSNDVAVEQKQDTPKESSGGQLNGQHRVAG